YSAPPDGAKRRKQVQKIPKRRNARTQHPKPKTLTITPKKVSFAQQPKAMIDLDYLNYLESFLTEDRKQKFLKVLALRTNHFCVAMEDAFQLHDNSAVMPACEAIGVQ